jgi:LysE type translocator
MSASDINPLLAFALTCVIIEITPGPNMTYLAALSLSNGMRTGYAAFAGVALGLMTYGVIAALGLAALIDNSSLFYGLLRWSGVAYLLWLAWESWASERQAAPQAADGKDRPAVADHQSVQSEGRGVLRRRAAGTHPDRRRPGGSADAAVERDLCRDRDLDPFSHRRTGRFAAGHCDNRRAPPHDTARPSTDAGRIAIWFALTTGRAP